MAYHIYEAENFLSYMYIPCQTLACGFSLPKPLYCLSDAINIKSSLSLVIESQTRCPDHCELYRQVESKNKRHPCRKTIDLHTISETLDHSTKEKLDIAKNKHVPISNIFMTPPKSLQSSTCSQRTGGVFYSYNSRPRTRSYPDKTLYPLPTRTSFPREPHGKDKKKRKMNSVG
jgi:hypothetical protein